MRSFYENVNVSSIIYDCEVVPASVRGRSFNVAFILRLKFSYAETRPVVWELKGRFVSNLAKETPDGGS